jgi:hypothetical protein
MAGKLVQLSTHARALWERCQDEPPRAYAAFCQYRDLGVRRSIENVRLALGRKDTRNIERWCGKWRWVMRARAWDAHLEAEYTREAQDATRGLKRRHLEMVQAMTQLTESEAAAHIRRAQQADANSPDRDTPMMSFTELKNTVKLVVELGTLLAGGFGDGEQATAGIDLTKLSVEELREYRRLRDKAQHGSEGS